MSNSPELTFAKGYISATFLDGSDVQFTKIEARLLDHFTQHGGQVQSRDNLLEALNGEGADKGDRSIDYLVTQLRRKLRDDPKTPRFIATRYGEGYVWLGAKQATAHPASGAHAVVGPCLGMEYLGEGREGALTFAQRFHTAFKQDFAEDLAVVFDPASPKAAEYGPDDAPTIGIEMSFVADGDQLDCVLRGSFMKTERTFYVARRRADQDSADAIALSLAEIRKHLALDGDKDKPLAVSMIDGGTTFSGVKGHWSENDESLRKIIANDPEDYRSKLMLATNIHT